MREDARILGAGVHVVVGTPGRVFDMLRRRCLRADNIKMFVLDEADEMLSRGFKDQIYDIFQLLPSKLQVRRRAGRARGRRDAAMARFAAGAALLRGPRRAVGIESACCSLADARPVSGSRRSASSPPPCPPMPWRSPASS